MQKILLIYHSNICNKSCGINSYLYNIFRILNRRGFELDIFVPKSFDERWETLEKDLIGNVFREDDQGKKIQSYIPGRVGRVLGIALKKINGILKLIFQEKKPAGKRLDWIDKSDIIRFKKVIRDNEYDYVVFSYVYYSKLLDFLPKNILKICSVSDFVSIQEMQHGKYKFGEVIEEEIAAIRKFDKAMFISSDEMAFFSNFINNVEFSYLPHYSERREPKSIIKDIDVLFIGSDNEHNVVGINWFLNKVYPKIKDNKYEIVIAGKISAKVNRSEYSEITFLDYVEDLDLLYSRVKVAISPLKSGTGIKIKIVEAMSHHIPIVCTSKSLVGFMEKADNGCIVADREEDFAKAVNDLLSSEALREKLSNQAKEQCEKYYNEKHAEKTLVRIFKQ